MKHSGYHAIRDAALRTFREKGDSAAIVQIITSADELYNSRDYSDWSKDEQVVFGMLTALDLVEGFGLYERRQSEVWKLCCEMVGEKTTESVALLVWKEVK